MKLLEIYWFELAYQSRRISTWLYFTVLLLLIWYMTREISTVFAGSEVFFFHSPIVAAIVTVYGGLVGLLIAAGIAGDAATRDVHARMDPLLYTLPVSKGAHLAGRFLAVFSLQAVILLAVPLAMMLVEVVPTREADLVGPFRPIVYLLAYGLIALPNAFVSVAFLFSIAALTRRATMSYLGALVLAMTSTFAWVYVAKAQGQWGLARLVDPAGGTVLGELAMRWTAAERSVLLIGPQEPLLLNRVLWMCIALGVLALTYSRYQLSHHAPGSVRRRINQTAEAEAVSIDAPITVPSGHRAFHAGTRGRQALEIAKQSYTHVLANWGAVAIAAIAALAVASGMDIEFKGVPLVATSGAVALMLAEEWWSLIVALLIGFYTGELIWRERDARTSEIADACPLPEWVIVVGKFAGLSLFIVTLQLVMLCSGVLVQAVWEQYNFALSVYARVLFGFQLVHYLLVAVLAFAVHTLVNHKYVGHFLFWIAYLVITIRRALGIENNLLLYGSDPGWAFSEMRGFEPFTQPWLWFKLYWTAWALLLALVTRLAWVRGRDTGIAARLALARGRFARLDRYYAAASAGLILLIGGTIFYNIHVVNVYDTTSDEATRRAEYERQFSKYANILQPQLTGTHLKVEMYPERREVEIRGAYRLVNASADAIDTVHLSTSTAVETTGIRFDRGAKNVLSDERLKYHIYALDPPLRRGEELRLDFEVHFKPRGFTNRAADAAVVPNGTRFTNHAWLPAIGYEKDRELGGAGERKQQGLASRPALPPPDDERARYDQGRGARVQFEATIGTGQGQIAVAPGKLKNSWTDNGRRYFHYATDVPIRNDYAFYSANYAVRQAQWRPPDGSASEVSIEVFYHPDHALNVDRMIRSVQASLDHYTRTLGPYPHRQVRFVEHPGDSVVLHAAPVNVSYDERFSLLNPDKDPRGLDLPFAVVAHEMAHQWWGNTVTGARAEGAALLSETLAWYSAMGVVEQALGHDHLPRLLRMMREAYLIPDTRANVPLLRAADPFLGYRKGPFAMYALREYVGREPIDRALRRYFDRYAAGALPLPTSFDLYRELQGATPESLRPLLADLFERNTFWELATERATAKQMEGGAWQVVLNVRARKVVVGEEGGEEKLPMNDPVEVGVFAGADDGALGEVLYLERHSVQTGESRIVVTVPRQPARAGIDPRRLLIDVDGDDNVREISR